MDNKLQELWFVDGTDELDGFTFAICSTEEKANKAAKLLHEKGFHDLIVYNSSLHLDEMIADNESTLL